MIAALMDQAEVVSYLIDIGADYETTADDGFRPIHDAACVEDTRSGYETTKVLIDAGADVAAPVIGGSADGSTALALASSASTINLILHTIAGCETLAMEAQNGNADEVWRLVHEDHTNMIHAGVHAADIARDAGHKELSAQMRDLWTRVYAHRGYDRHNRDASPACAVGHSAK